MIGGIVGLDANKESKSLGGVAEEAKEGWPAKDDVSED
jgi:hypothetical protein